LIVFRFPIDFLSICVDYSENSMKDIPLELPERPKTKRKGGKRPGAGRPLGRLNESTMDKISAIRAFRARVLQELEPLIKAHLKAAKAGNIQALNSLWDRVIGPPALTMDLDVRGTFTDLVRVVHEHRQSSSSVTPLIRLPIASSSVTIDVSQT